MSKAEIPKAKLYRLADRMNRKERKRFNCDDSPNAKYPSLYTGPAPEQRDGFYVMAILTGSVREPRKGEWYLSGARPMAYRAPNNLSTRYGILRLVKIKRSTITTYEVI